jgi:ankyrin repeat protein
MEQRQKEASKPKKLRQRTRQALASAAKSLKRVFAGRRLDEALLKAAKDGWITAIGRLLDAGASINMDNKCGIAVLMVAAANGRIGACKLLINKGAIIDETDKAGNTALMYAAMHRQRKTCALLVRKGADVGAMNKNGKTALAIAEQAAPMMRRTPPEYKEICGFLGFMESMQKSIGKAAFSSFLSAFSECVASP